MRVRSPACSSRRIETIGLGGLMVSAQHEHPTEIAAEELQGAHGPPPDPGGDQAGARVLGKKDERKRRERQKEKSVDERRRGSRRSRGRKGDRESDEADSLAVPPELAAEAERAAKQWDMKLKDMAVAATKPEKGGAIWRIETSRGTRSLKLLHRPTARSLFSVFAQEYLVRRRARVPRLIPTRDGHLYAVLNGRVWIVCDWIEGLRPASKVDLAGAEALCFGLGEFHRHSLGYEPPPGADYASRLHRWPNTYRKLRHKLDWFADIARLYKDQPASATLLKVTDHFRAQADEAIARLERSPYGRLVERGEPAWGLVHQDYGWSNGQLGPGGLWIIDLDGVAYDLPIRDLRKLIAGTMDDRGDWDIAWAKAMLKAYHKANPIEEETMQVMLIDLLLPNEFYKLVKEIVFNPAMLDQEMDLQLRRLMEADHRKQRALSALGLKRK